MLRDIAPFQPPSFTSSHRLAPPAFQVTEEESEGQRGGCSQEGLWFGGCPGLKPRCLGSQDESCILYDTFSQEKEFL